MPLPLALEHLRDGRIRDLATYWLAKRGTGMVPKRRDIDPVDIPWALEFVWLCDYLPTERNFRYRLAGEAINDAQGRNMSRRRLGESFSPSTYAIVADRYQRIVDEPAIGHGIGAVYLNLDRPVTGERIVFPLSKDGDRVDMILGMTLYELGSIHPHYLTPNKALQFTHTPLTSL